MGTTATVLVTGATGTIGSGLIPELQAADVSVRALVRDAAKATALRAQGVQTVLGDLDRPETLDAAVAGVDKVLLVTWNGPTAPRQARNIIQATQRAGRPHIVRIAAHGPQGSRIVRDHLVIEDELKASGLPWTILRPTFFMQNLMMAAQSVASEGMIYLPFKTGRVGMVDVRDIVDVAARVLTTDGHEGHTYILTGPQAVSLSEVAGAFSAALGTPVTYVDIPPEAAKQFMLGMGMPEWIADGYRELFDGFANNFASRVSPDVSRVTGNPGRGIAQFARDFAPVFGRSLVGVS
jgi:uncharacterized protein YbjT (DUF2867 family)